MLPNYDPQASLVVFDASRFYAASDITVGDDTPGCMGFAPDTPCAPLYNTLGVTPWDDATPGPAQTAFVLTTGPALVASKGTVAPQRKIYDPTAWPDLTFQRPSALDTENISRAGDADSHPQGDPRYGVNCMRCIRSMAPALASSPPPVPSWTRRASRAREPRSSSSRPTSKATRSFENIVSRAVLEVDANGNFFTTAPLPLDTHELGARVLGADGLPVTMMPFTQQTAACNNCHVGGMRLTLPAP